MAVVLSESMEKLAVDAFLATSSRFVPRPGCSCLCWCSCCSRKGKDAPDLGTSMVTQHDTRWLGCVCVKHAEHCDDTSDSNIFVCMEFDISVLWHSWYVIYCDSMSAFFKKLVTGTFSISKQLKLMTRLANLGSTYLWYLWLPRPYSSVVEQCYDLVDGPRPLGDFDARMEIRSVRGLQNDDKTDMCFRYFITCDQ